jgi:hypothetical protein
MSTPQGIPVLPGLSNTDIFEKGLKFPEGQFDADFVKAEYANTNHGPCVFFTFKVTNTYGNTVVQVGEERTWKQSLAKPNIAKPAIAAFLVALLGFDYSKQKAKVDAEIKPRLDAIFNTVLTEGFGVDRPVRIITKATKTQANFDYVKHEFFPGAAA